MSTDNLTSVFTRFRARLRGVAAAIVGGDGADDVVHDAFCNLWARNCRVRSEAEAMRLSYTAVRNSAIDSFRRSRSHPTVSLEVTQTDIQGVADSDRQDDSSLVYDAVIKLARDVLTDRSYEIFRLHDIEGVSFDELAERMSTTPVNIRVSLSRSRKTIREIYRKNNNDF